MVSPQTPEDVATVLRHASAKSLNVQVWGGGTRSGYGEPAPPDIVMTMDRLSDVEVWEPDDLTVVLGAGTRVEDVESMLADRNQTAVLPESAGRSTVGGVLAAGASSLRRGRLYGTRERVLEVTVVTGDGRIVRAGGRVVKNVTGYDLPRLTVGAFGSLGVIVSVCLKLWPAPPNRATVTVSSIEEALEVVRPLAVLEDNDSTRVYVWGTAEEISAKVAKLGGDGATGHHWPSDPDGDYRWSLRVPPAMTLRAIEALPDGWTYLAVHGVGDIRAASPDAAGAFELREWAESVGGHLVVVASPEGSETGLDPWGKPPPAMDIQRRLIAQFDPARIINPGRLPGGL